MKVSRRSLLAGISVLAALAIEPSLARPLKGGLGISFNGGKSQTASGLLGYFGDYPFINELKQSQPWQYINGTLPIDHSIDPSDLTTDGYPVAGFDYGTHGGIFTKIYTPTALQRPGVKKVVWSGTGTMFLGGGAALDTGSLSTSGFTFTFTGNNYLFGIVAGTNVRDLIVYNINDQPLIDAGEIFNSQYVNVIAAMGVGVIRFLDWCGGSGGIGLSTTWATRKPSTYITYAAPEVRGAIYQGVASSSDGIHYKINIGGSPTNGQILTVKIGLDGVGPGGTIDAATVPQFSIDNGSTYLNMGYNSGSSLVGFSNMKLNAFATLIFDSTLNVWMKFGGDANGSYYLDNGVPPEICLELTKKVRCHPYFVAPVFAAGFGTDYMSSLATSVRTNGYSWMIPRFEGPNEVWNNATFLTAYANNVQCVQNGGPKPYFSDVPYPVTGVSWTGSGATGTATLTITGSLPPLGACIILLGSGWGTAGGLAGNSYYVVAVGAGTVQISGAPTSGTSPVTGLSTSFSGASINNGGLPLSDWYGQRMSIMGQQINAVYGGTPGALYHVIIGVKAANGGSTSDYPRVASTSYSIAQGTNNTPNLTVCAFNWSSHVAPAIYIRPSLWCQNQEVILAYQYATAPTTAIIDTYCDSLNNNSGFNDNNMAAQALNYQGVFNNLCNVNWGGNSGYSQAPFKPGGGTKNQKMCAYEGGYSADFLSFGTTPSYIVTSPVSAATKDAAGVVVTLATTNVQGNINSGVALDGTSITAGAQLTFSSVVGMTQLNGLTGTVIGVGVASGLSANQVRLNINSSGFSTYVSGGDALYVGPAAGGSKRMFALLNALRNAGKFSSHLAGYTYGGYLGSNSNYGNFVAAGGEFPSQFIIAGAGTGPEEGTDYDIVASGGGTCWGLYDPDVFTPTPSPALTGIALYNVH